MQPAKESSSLSLHDALAMSSRPSKFKLKSICSNLFGSFVSFCFAFGQFWSVAHWHSALGHNTCASHTNGTWSALFWASGYFRIPGRPDEWACHRFGHRFWLTFGHGLCFWQPLHHSTCELTIFFFFMLFKPRFECTRMAGESKVWQSMTTSNPRLTASAGLSSWPSGQTAVIQLILKRYLKK